MDHPINIVVVNNAAGIPPSSDGVMMLICKAVAISTTFVLDTAYLITQLSDLATLGVTAATDTSGGVAVCQQVSEFYGKAGDGAKLWLVGTAISNAYATYVAGATFKGLIRGTSASDPLNRVKMAGFCYDVPVAGQTATDFPADVLATIPALHLATTQLFNEGYQFSSILDGYNMSSTVTPSTITSVATLASPSVSLCITGTKPNGVSSVGLALGRLARISIGHGFGAVADGPVNTSTAYLTNGILISTAMAVAKLTPADVTSLGQKQFMFLRTWFNHSGFFWNDGATCEVSTKQLSTQEYNRVANAISADALSFFIEEMGKNLPLDVKTGNVDAIYLNAKQKEFYDAYIAPLTITSGSGDVSDASIVVTGVNFNATKTLNFTINIVPTPILGKVNGTIQFTATL